MSDIPLRLFVDCDTGLDDALALAFLGGSPEVELLAAGSVHGNVGSARAAQNTRMVLARTGSAHVPVFQGAVRPLLPATPRISARHAPDGLGGLSSSSVPGGETTGSGRPGGAEGLPDAHGGPGTLRAADTASGRTASPHAAEQLVALVRSCAAEGRPISILAIGPLTNLAVALTLEPDLPCMVDRVVVMGGSFDEGGLLQPMLPESNVGADPEAAAAVLGAGLPLTLVPLDVTRTALLPPAVADRIALGGEVGSFCAQLAERYAESYGSCSTSPSCPLHDPLAAAVAVAPDLATFESVDVSVALCGSPRATTSASPVPAGTSEHARRGSQVSAVSLVRSVDVGRFVEMFASRVSR